MLFGEDCCKCNLGEYSFKKMSLACARKTALEKHNQLRSLHYDTPPMKLAVDLNEKVIARLYLNLNVKIIQGTGLGGIHVLN